MASSLGSITTLPHVPAYIQARAKQLGIKRHAYLALILHNYLHGPPLALPVVSDPPRRLKRPKIQVSMPSTLRAAGARRAAKWQMSFSALMTSLVVADADSGLDELVLYPVRGVEKPTLPELD